MNLGYLVISFKVTILGYLGQKLKIIKYYIKGYGWLFLEITGLLLKNLLPAIAKGVMTTLRVQCFYDILRGDYKKIKYVITKELVEEY